MFRLPQKIIAWWLVLKAAMLYLAYLNWEDVPLPLKTFQVSYDQWLQEASNVTFPIMDEKTVQFLQLPPECDKDTLMVVMVLSAPKHFNARVRIRDELKHFKMTHVRTAFLLGRTNDGSVQDEVVKECGIFHDIVQISVEEGYNKLSYKTISGFLWTRKYCAGTKYLLKIDDDVSMDWPRVLNELTMKYPEGMPENVLECPSVMRNMRPWRPKRNSQKSIMGKWAVSYKEMSRRVYPDFCPGWAYVTSPVMGQRISEAAASIEQVSPMKRLDDIYITGYALERIQGSRIAQLKPGYSGYMWNNWLSMCPFLGITKNIFFNDYVLKKGVYVNNHKFFWCAFYEYFILDNIEYLAPGLTPKYLIALCER